MTWASTAPSPTPAGLISLAYSIVIGRAHHRHGVRVPLEEHVLVMAPPRSGKTGWLARVIVHYLGPVLSTTIRPDVYALTGGLRARRGPIAVFNPQAIGGITATSTFRWSPVEGCRFPRRGRQPAVRGGDRRRAGLLRPVLSASARMSAGPRIEALAALHQARLGALAPRTLAVTDVELAEPPSSHRTSSRSSIRGLLDPQPHVGRGELAAGDQLLAPPGRTAARPRSAAPATAGQPRPAVGSSHPAGTRPHGR